MTRVLTREKSNRLSDVARHVIYPEGIVSTGWPAVRRTLAELGVFFDPWQQGASQLILSKDKDGMYATTVGGVTMSIPRQVGKTFMIGWVVFALCIIEPGLTVVWTAHLKDTANETFDEMKAMAGLPQMAAHIDRTPDNGSEQKIEFSNGSRVVFGARERGFGRGFTKLDIVVFDEAQILTERSIDDMVPAQNASQNALTVFIGTPPKPNNPSQVFTDARDAALSGAVPDGLYIELSADEDADPDDRAQWRKANPSYPHRTNEASMLRMRRRLSRDSFRREALGIWDRKIAGSNAFTKTAWSALKGPAPDSGRIAYGVKFTVDGSGVGLASAVRPEDDGPVFVRPIKQANLGEGLDWLVDYLVDRAAGAAQIVIDGKSGVGFLVNALRDAGVRNKRLIIVPRLEQVLAAHSMFEQSVRTGMVSHPGVKAFDAQVTWALKRKIGTAGGFGWDAPAGKTVVTLDAATLALWGAKTTKRRPGRGGQVL
ncbi:terminase large subunit domain-containing protein [Glutamicibacter creatinolyticus]|uniref:terminase large subunit domain-containing protein n=1 Tax=Glutamicibacter creatinolyticus TaxID=162496 RepID=UPI0031D724E2